MLKLKTILFIALAVTVGGVYAAWSYPTYVGTYSSNVEVSIEIEIAETVETSVFNVEISDLKLYISWDDGSNRPDVYIGGYIAVSGTLPEELNIEDFEDKTLYVQFSNPHGVSEYQTDDGFIDIFDYPTYRIGCGGLSFDDYNRECYLYNDFFQIFDEEQGTAITINPAIPFDTYEQYQKFLGCFEEDACLEMTISIE